MYALAVSMGIYVESYNYKEADLQYAAIYIASSSKELDYIRKS